MKPVLVLVMCFLCAHVFGQWSLTGMVTDQNGKPIIGATLQEKENLTNGTITDADGRFSLRLSDQSNAVVITYTGFTTKEVPVSKGTKDITIVLEESTALLSEVLVIGYGSTSRKMSTDNVAKLTADDVSNIAVSNFQSTMSGKAAGVRINQVSGKVDGAINIQIRGTASLSAGKDPLYVLDGMPLINVDESNNGAPMNPLLSLSPSEIESIDILKDASSAAIYGARGANGVILITTKKGKAGQPNISLNMSTGISSPTHLQSFLNATEYKELFTEAAINSFGQDDGIAEIEADFDFLSNGTDWRNNAVNTDWNNLAFRDGHQSDLDLSVSGGDLKTQYYIGGSLNKTKGILLGNQLERMGARINLNHQLSSRINAGMNLGISKTKIERVDNDNSFTSPLETIGQSPLSPAYNDDGSINPNTLYPNFLLEDKYANYTTRVRRVTGKIFAQYNFINDFRFNSDLGYDLSDQTEDQYRGTQTPFMSTNGYAYNSHATSENYIWSNYVTYEKSFAQASSLNVVVGQEFNNSDRVFTSVTGTQFPSDDFQSISSAAEITAGEGSKGTYNFLSYFARASVNLKGKYFIKGSVRRDGSSRFGIDERYGIFPAVSLGWILSEESFLKDNSTLSFLKIRGSYGQLGNSEIGNFASKTLYNGVSYNKIAGIKLEQPGNNSLTWEKSKQLDLGLEFGLFNDILSGELDVYTKNTDGLLFNVPLPGSSGQSSFNKNIGSLESKGVELVLESKNVSTKNMTWTTSFNIAKNTNKIKSLPNGNADIISSENINRIGETVNSFYLVEFAGADPANGDALYYKDGVGSETTNNYDEANRVIAGSTQPTLISGLTNEVSYKGIALSFTFVGEWGASIYNGAGVYQSSSADFFDNQTRDQLDRWQNPGDITQVPQARLYGQNGNAQSTRYLQKADFIRLRNVMLSYTLPKSITQKVNISNARIFISGVNLLTFTEYTGYDPEARADFGNYATDHGWSFYSAPQAKTTSVGINVNF
ncbi:MAG: TonB-dependent receptor [Saprospiraceae bacterium]|uniref:TonB-dependent receptor n=1 Tax=Candidatus Opimibacter skivensis TaxID=2982028 RepID=A0A9D7XNE9_9BACT|nr:TonB-dependent receptor [Candidatus Opimibacter skivensis]